MKTRGELMLDLFKGMQRLNEEIAALIKTADNLLSKKGYVPEGGSGVIRETSNSLDAPDKWTPRKMYRIYQNKQNNDDVIVLNIRLDGQSKSKIMTEPLLLCGRFLYNKGQAQKSDGYWGAWDMWKHRAVSKMDTGRVYTKDDLYKDKVNLKEFFKESGWDLDEVEAMKAIYFIALPLAEIQDLKALAEVLQRIIL